MNTIISVREEQMSNELMKYHIEGLPFDAVIHKFTGVDQGDPHDHPFTFRSFVLKGGYVERRYSIKTICDVNFVEPETIQRAPGDSFMVQADTIHEVIHLPDGECWTLILPEKWEKKPGFYKFADEILHRFWDEADFKPLK